MKPSFYNFFFPYEHEEGKYIAYNSLSNSMALLEANKYQQYLDFVEKGIPIEDEKLLNGLKRGSFLQEDAVDEAQVIRHNMYKARFSTRGLTLTLAVTSDCNFRCVYCYEKNALNSCYMNEEIEESIFKFAEKQIKTIGRLTVSWYGGEPLMNVATIERLSARFIKLCEENEVDYVAGIVTNGYNLTKENLDLLKRCRVTTMQITLDGDAEIHDQRRPLQNGQPTFDRIIGNLLALKDELITTSLRINTDKENYDRVETVLKVLHENGLEKIVNPYIARVDSNNDNYDNDTCLSIVEFLNNRKEFIGLKAQYGYDMGEYWKTNYPKRKHQLCSCDAINAFIINADGEMYKCWENIGDIVHSFGNIKKASGHFSKSFYDYSTFDPTLDEHCSICKYVPICMGGCALRRKVDRTSVCDETKYNFEEKLKAFAQRLKQERQEEALQTSR